MNEDNLFSEFLGQEVKAPYKDGNQFKIARGVLEDISNGFVKIKGKLGTIIINQKNIEKVTVVKGTNQAN
ncbi:hypothetical protein HYY70_04130 [Candidatus Woesearchaeota archaeon]|nr:hypothetical protein [Candidatus Woesearchaeota archaeon]